jgi:anti-sigma regulatory factor (Ser/Thr protein kinase)
MGPRADPLALRLPATAASVRELRAHVRDWLGAIGAGNGDVIDLQLACSEVLTLVLEQSPTPVALVVDVDAAIDEETVTVAIREYGLCHSSGVDLLAGEGFGPELILAMVDDFVVESHADGRTIVLVRRLRTPRNGEGGHEARPPSRDGRCEF